MKKQAFNTYNLVIDDKFKADIRLFIASGVPIKKLAARFGTSEALIKEWSRPVHREIYIPAVTPGDIETARAELASITHLCNQRMKSTNKNQ